MELGAVCVLNLRYLQWADERILEAASRLAHDQALADRGSSFGGILGTLQHIYRAERVWLARLTGDPDAQVAAIDAPADTVFLKAVWPQLHEQLIAWAESVDNWDVRQPARTKAGGEYSLPRWQYVLHLVNHSTYHRGQVTTMLRQAGAAPPPSTDLVAFYREMATEPAGDGARTLTRSQGSRS